MDEEIKQNMTEEILRSFHNQFAENQNHQQKLFIQFFSAILIVVIPFGFVFLNTSNNADNTDNAEFSNIQENSLSHLIATWLLVQIVSTTLSSFALKIGYSFRRDQKVVENIRRHYLDKNIYGEIFGEKSFSSINKKMWRGNSYLPLFCALFWQFAVAMQWLISVAMIYKIYFISPPFSLWITLILLICILKGLPYFWRYYFFLKYKRTVEGTEPKRHWISFLFDFFLDDKKSTK